MDSYDQPLIRLSLPRYLARRRSSNSKVFVSSDCVRGLLPNRAIFGHSIFSTELVSRRGFTRLCDQSPNPKSRGYEMRAIAKTLVALVLAANSIHDSGGQFPLELRVSLERLTWSDFLESHVSTSWTTASRMPTSLS